MADTLDIETLQSNDGLLLKKMIFIQTVSHHDILYHTADYKLQCKVGMLLTTNSPDV